MRIEHIALYTNRLEALKGFYEKYFKASSGNMYHNPKTGLKTYFLSFEDGARLEIMSRPDIAGRPQDQYLKGYVHLAFSLGSKEAVDYLTKRLAADGFNILGGPRTTGDGYYESTAEDPDVNVIELTV